MIPLLSYFAITGGVLICAWFAPPATIAGLVLMKLFDFWGQLASPYFYEHEQFTNLLLSGTLLFAMLKARFARPRMNYGFPWSYVSIVALWVYAALSLSWSLAPTEGIEQWTTYAPYIALTLIAPLLFYRHDDLELGLLSITIMGGALAILFLIFGNWESRSLLALWSPTDSIWDPLAFGQASGFVTIIAVLLSTTRVRFWSMLRWVPVMAGVVLAAKSGSRGQFVLMVVLPVLFLLWRRGHSKFAYGWALVSAIILIGAIANIALEQVIPLDDRWTSQRFVSDMELRVNMISRLLRAWASNPLAIVMGLGSSARREIECPVVFEPCKRKPSSE